MTAVLARTDAPTTETAATPRWARPALIGLLAATAALLLWNLSANGFGNDFYAAAAQAGSRRWSAWFFGSLDVNNFVTVDKPPAALWVTGLSVRLFGMNPWAVQVPQALMGVAAVGVLYATVRRALPEPGQGAAAGLLAGAVLAATPAAVLIFRYNNPDALMVLLTVVAAYCSTRATASASWRWLALAGVALGFAFLTKMLAGLMVLPAFALAYLLFAPTGWRKRLAHLLIAAAALVTASGWWVLAVQLWPAGARPYISNSGDNSVLGLALGYNGMDRIVGTNAHGARGAGLRRLFVSELGNEISWLLPVALIALAFGLYVWLRGGLSRTEKSALTLWGTWLVLCGATFSYMDGLSHPYYTAAMAPALAALVGLGGVWAWRRRSGWDGRIVVATMIAVAAAWSVQLLHTAQFGAAWPRWLIAAAAAVAVIAVMMPRVTSIATVIGMLAGLGGTAAFAVATAATPHTGSIPNAVHTATASPTVGNRFARSLQLGNLQYNAALAAALHDTHTTWAAATSGSAPAAALEVASGKPVMAIGGWTHDPVPTLAQFVADVRAGRIAYYVESGRGRGKSSYGRDISEWVARNYPVTNIGGTRVFRLT